MIEMLFVLALLGVAVYVVNTLIPMDARFKTLITIVAAVLAVWYVLHWFGLVTGPPVK